MCIFNRCSDVSPCFNKAFGYFALCDPDMIYGHGTPAHADATDTTTHTHTHTHTRTHTHTHTQARSFSRTWRRRIHSGQNRYNFQRPVRLRNLFDLALRPSRRRSTSFERFSDFPVAYSSLAPWADCSDGVIKHVVALKVGCVFTPLARLRLTSSW